MAIAPDHKDWTWVVDRPCPECGFDTSSFPREQVGTMVRENASAWVQQLEQRSERGDVAVRPAAGTPAERWSPLEYACHVRDVFRLYETRLHLMLDEDDPLFQDWDQNVTAREDRYGEQDPATVAVELQEAADRLADSFDGVGVDAVWQRPGRRSDGASFTVESFARYFIHDPVHHLTFDVD